jgi:hypothetical protein
LIFGKVFFLVARFILRLNRLFLDNNRLIVILIILYHILSIVIILLHMCPPINFVIVVIIISFLIELAFQKDSFKVIIFIRRRVLVLAIGVVVIVELIVPATVLVEKVNVLAVLYLEAFAACDFCEYFETLRVGGSVGLHAQIFSR